MIKKLAFILIAGFTISNYAVAQNDDPNFGDLSLVIDLNPATYGMTLEGADLGLTKEKLSIDLTSSMAKKGFALILKQALKYIEDDPGYQGSLKLEIDDQDIQIDLIGGDVIKVGLDHAYNYFVCRRFTRNH